MSDRKWKNSPSRGSSSIQGFLYGGIAFAGLTGIRDEIAPFALPGAPHHR
ncbi:hypothetical protein KIH31_08065 [Paenarthrobacter sp. DKR-5]|nr:hypothetical protein [Paenarthrobacter sp. DKR-5]MBT1002558.1 hypothetical protein [Paenarthrobacter sp. DKR-5]